MLDFVIKFIASENLNAKNINFEDLDKFQIAIKIEAQFQQTILIKKETKGWQFLLKLCTYFAELFLKKVITFQTLTPKYKF